MTRLRRLRIDAELQLEDTAGKFADSSVSRADGAPCAIEGAFPSDTRGVVNKAPIFSSDGELFRGLVPTLQNDVRRAHASLVQRAFVAEAVESFTARQGHSGLGKSARLEIGRLMPSC